MSAHRPLQSDSVGFQIPGGPFVQLGYVQNEVYWTFSLVQDDGTTVSSGELRFQGSPELMLEAAACMPELASACRAMAERGLDFKAQLREVTF